MKKPLFSLCFIASTSMPILSVIACNNDFESNKANARIQAVTIATAMVPTQKNKVQYGAKPASSDINPPSQTGSSFSFKEASTINEHGEAKVTYIVDVMPAIEGTTPKELTFIVGGFETKAEAEIRLANAKINDVSLSTVALPTQKNKVRYGAKPASSDINPPSQTGFSFNFQEASAINDQGEAKVTYTVDVMPAIRGTTAKELTFIVGGFQTKAKANVRLANAKIQAVTTTTVAPPTQKSMVQYGVKPVFDDINPPSQTGFSFSFQEVTAVNDQGEVRVTYTVDVMPVIRGTTTKELTFIVDGFQTKARADAWAKGIRRRGTFKAVPMLKAGLDHLKPYEIPPTKKDMDR